MLFAFIINYIFLFPLMNYNIHEWGLTDYN